MSDYTEPTPAPEPVVESDPLDDDDDDHGYWIDDWYFATSSEEIAKLLIDKLAEKQLTKVMWTRVIAEMHAAFYDQFLERVGVDDVTPAAAAR